MLTSTIATIASLFMLFAPPPSTPPAAAPKIPEAVFVAEKPKDPKGVAEVRKTAKKGDTVVIAAKIGGRAEPFVKNRAVFLVADRALKSCDQIPDDPCKTPWDYCCEPPESKKINMMTVQVVGDDGKPIKIGAQSTGGLEPLTLIVFEGTVAEIDDKGTFIVNAKKIFVEKADKKSPAK